MAETIGEMWLKKDPQPTYSLDTPYTFDFDKTAIYFFSHYNEKSYAVFTRYSDHAIAIFTKYSHITFTK
jgi:hypothetical protein